MKILLVCLYRPLSVQLIVPGKEVIQLLRIRHGVLFSSLKVVLLLLVASSLRQPPVLVNFDLACYHSLKLISFRLTSVSTGVCSYCDTDWDNHIFVLLCATILLSIW